MKIVCKLQLRHDNVSNIFYFVNFKTHLLINIVITRFANDTFTSFSYFRKKVQFCNSNKMFPDVCLNDNNKHGPETQFIILNK